MRCIILAEDQVWKELFEDKEEIVELHEVDSAEAFSQADGDVFFDFRDEAWDPPSWPLQTLHPVFIAGITGTLKEHHCPQHFIRLNTWPGMLSRAYMECVASETIRPEAEKVLKVLHKKVEWLPDTPGMVSPKVLSMIINEAWFAFEEGVSTKNDIDTAMKLGTNYPLGPFAWGNQIGLHRVCRLLSVLAAENERYRVATSLLMEVGL
jgi:3-hydroxybutyryl-CoA dehydrogenase